MQTLASDHLEKRCYNTYLYELHKMNLTTIINERLSVLQPSTLKIIDDSAQHVGHKGNTGGGHFSIVIVSSHFLQKSQIMRHRLIYQALSDLIPQQIHALSIQAYAPHEPT